MNDEPAGGASGPAIAQRQRAFLIEHQRHLSIDIDGLRQHRRDAAEGAGTHGGRDAGSFEHRPLRQVQFDRRQPQTRLQQETAFVQRCFQPLARTQPSRSRVRTGMAESCKPNRSAEATSTSASPIKLSRKGTAGPANDPSRRNGRASLPLNCTLSSNAGCKSGAS